MFFLLIGFCLLGKIETMILTLPKHFKSGSQRPNEFNLTPQLTIFFKNINGFPKQFAVPVFEAMEPINDVFPKNIHE